MTTLDQPAVRFPAADLAALKRAFDAEGFCIAAALFAPSEVAEIRDFFQERTRLKAEKGGFDKSMLAGEQGAGLQQWPRYLHPHRDHELARRYLLHPKVRTVLQRLFGTDPLAAQSMYYYKAPGAKGQQLHQDNMYLQAEPHTCIAAWTAIDDADEANGGLMLVPGTENMELDCRRDENGVGHGRGVQLPEGAKAGCARMRAGDTVFFNGQIVHGSGANRTTDRFRRSFIGHYISGTSEKVAGFYHPVLDFEGNVASIDKNVEGGPCGFDMNENYAY
jgi:ectoine hydroxylase-related dioxygenase (phytanoyl-CoA dioxygenase family)